MHLALGAFEPLKGRGVGAEDLLCKGAEPQIAASYMLGNVPHLDEDDVGHCMAMWVRMNREVKGRIEWWFLVPSVGLAIELRHGCLLSWEGARVGHCTAVPQGVHESDALLSLYVGRYSRAGGVAARRAEFRDAVAVRDAQRKAGCELALVPGESVWVQYEPFTGSAGWLRATGELERYASAGDAGVPADVTAPGRHALVSWTGPHGPARGTTAWFPEATVHAAFVRAGAVAATPDWAAGCELVGKRIRVYFVCDDALYPGCVTAYDPDEGYVVDYDDGDRTEGELFWDSGAAGFVMCSD